MENLNVKFIDPQAVIGQLEFRNGMKVADFGCGAGFFSLAIAQKIGKEGEVCAFDILPEKLETVQSRAKILGLTNVLVKRANLEMGKGSGLPDASVDLVILKDMLYQNGKKDKILAEAGRILKKDGKILLIEWKTETTSIGPQASLRVSKEKMIDLLQQNGLGVLKEIKAGDFHYGLLIIK